MNYTLHILYLLTFHSFKVDEKFDDKYAWALHTIDQEIEEYHELLTLDGYSFENFKPTSIVIQ